MSQRVLNMLGSPRAYGSHAQAAAAGWRWNAAPNHRARSHNHQWWPPQRVADEFAAAHGEAALVLPIGTTKAIEVLEWRFE